MKVLLVSAIVACVLLHSALAQQAPEGSFHLTDPIVAARPSHDPAPYDPYAHRPHHPRMYRRRKSFWDWLLSRSASDEYYSASWEHHYRRRRDANELMRVKA